MGVMRAPVAGSGWAPACTAKVSKPYSAIPVLRLESELAAQLFVRNHDVLAVGRTLAHARVPGLDVGELRDRPAERVVAIEMHARGNVGDGEFVTCHIGPCRENGIE